MNNISITNFDEKHGNKKWIFIGIIIILVIAICFGSFYYYYQSNNNLINDNESSTSNIENNSNKNESKDKYSHIEIELDDLSKLIEEIRKFYKSYLYGDYDQGEYIIKVKLNSDRYKYMEAIYKYSEECWSLIINDKVFKYVDYTEGFPELFEFDNELFITDYDGISPLNNGDIYVVGNNLELNIVLNNVFEYKIENQKFVYYILNLDDSYNIDNICDTNLPAKEHISIFRNGNFEDLMVNDKDVESSCFNNN